MNDTDYERPHTPSSRWAFIKGAIMAGAAVSAPDLLPRGSAARGHTQLRSGLVPELWQQESFTMRAPAARLRCGDFCFVWEGSPESLIALLDRVGAEVIVGPAPRSGGRACGTVGGTSRYIRDPDGNLVEFITYS